MLPTVFGKRANPLQQTPARPNAVINPSNYQVHSTSPTKAENDPPIASNNSLLRPDKAKVLEQSHSVASS